MELLTRNNFEDWMQKLMERLDRQDELLLSLRPSGKKTYYSEEDVLTFLSEHVKDFRKEDIAFYKARIHNFFNK